MSERWAPPRLPDLDGLAKESAWITGCAGLTEELERLSEHATTSRPRFSKQAAALAKPSFGPATLLALLRTLFRFFAFTVIGGVGEARHRIGRRLRRRGVPTSGSRPETADNEVLAVRSDGRRSSSTPGDRRM